jgi:hypothetical protein
MAKTLIDTVYDSDVDGAVCVVDVTSGIDGTYPVYEFHFVNMHPQTDADQFQFQANAATGSNTSGFNQFITSTAFLARHNEAGNYTTLTYDAGADQGQTQLYQSLTTGTGYDNDQSCSGMLTLYAPSSTTYVKHFMSTMDVTNEGDYVDNCFRAGYINAEEAIDEISFKFSSGDIDVGTIKMFGVS